MGKANAGSEKKAVNKKYPRKKKGGDIKKRT